MRPARSASSNPDWQSESSTLEPATFKPRTALQPLADNHDPSDFAAAMAAAQNVEVPRLGVYFKAERPTLADGMNDVVARARNGGGDQRTAAG